MVRDNRRSSTGKNDVTPGKNTVTDRNDGLPPRKGHLGRRSFLGAVGSAVGLSLTANGALANEGDTDVENEGDTDAEKNDGPGAAHLGGGRGYPNMISRSEATVVVSTFDEFEGALADADDGDVVYVAGDASIDVGANELTIPAGVTLASNRGIDGAPGGLVETTSLEQWPGPLTVEDGVHITGLRLAGPVDEHVEYSKPITNGLVVEGSECEIDNVEMWGFNHAAILLYEAAHVHHSHIHHNCMDGLGYGINCKGGDSTVIEHNYFNFNRHSVANDGTAGYIVRHNHFGKDAVAHQVDAHRPGGTTLEIHHNTFVATKHLNDGGDPDSHVSIRGVPSDIATIHHNWFYNPLEPSPGRGPESVIQPHVDEFTNLELDANAYGDTEPPLDIGCPRRGNALTDIGRRVRTALDDN